jgi:hypothetical protein
MRFFVPGRSARAVVIIGRVVVRRRCRVRASPMPREAGEVRIQGWTIVNGVEREDYLRGPSQIEVALSLGLWFLP